MTNTTVALFRPILEDNLKILENDVCNACDARIKHPLLPWLVGANYWSTKERLLFVGKPHRGTPGDILPSGIIDPTEMVEDLITKSWPYWSYTKDIITNIYGSEDKGWDSISFTNIIKCTNTGAEDGGSPTDQTSHTMAVKCIKELGVIFHEIRLLKPKKIVFYTYSLFRELLRDFPIEADAHCREITLEGNRVPCGQKYVPWWERSFSTSWYEDVRVLIVGHPERMKKREYVGLITTWVRKW